MQLHKHSFVRRLTAFSLSLILFLWFGMGTNQAVQAASISDLKARKAALEAAEAETLAELDMLQQLTVQLYTQKAELNEMISKAPNRSLVLFEQYADTLERLETAESDLMRLSAEKEQLQAERTALEAEFEDWYAEYRAALAAASLNAGGAVKADAVWPMPGYTAITCMFQENGHRGVDISGAGIYGAPIVAAADGVVTWSGWRDSYGYCVFLDHGDGFSTRYAHASGLNCKAGDRVAAGETIAYVGSTGNSTGPHLHFEVLRSGTLQDPLSFYE